LGICEKYATMQWRSQPKIFLGGKMFDFRRITLFCLEKRFSKHKMTTFSKNFFGVMALSTPLATPMPPWASQGGGKGQRPPWILKILAKKVLFLDSSGKKQIHDFWTP